MAKGREGEKEFVEEEEHEEKKEKKGEAQNKKYDLAKRITKQSGGDKGEMKKMECKICGEKHKTSEHHKEYSSSNKDYHHRMGRTKNMDGKYFGQK